LHHLDNTFLSSTTAIIIVVVNTMEIEHVTEFKHKTANKTNTSKQKM